MNSSSHNGEQGCSHMRRAIVDFYDYQTAHYRPTMTRDDLLTVVVTNYQREEFLTPCIESVAAGGIRNIVVASVSVSVKTIEIHKALLRKYPYLQVFLFEHDRGCNELWLQSLYHVTTPYVLILHDDDELAPDFGAYYWGIIRPELARSAGWVLWDGRVKEDGRLLDEYHSMLPLRGGGLAAAGYYEPTELLAVYRDKHQSSYPISPVVQIMQTSVCKHALKECELGFTDPVHYTRPTMMVGNDVMLTLRNLQAAVDQKQRAFYVPHALTYFGRHRGSESQVQLLSGSNAFLNGCAAARDHFNAHWHNDSRRTPRLIHAVNVYSCEDPATRRRMRVAMQSWMQHYESGRMIFCPVSDFALGRDSSLVGDERPVPFVRDLIEAGLRLAAPEDAVVVTNADICLASDAEDRILTAVRVHGCCFAFRRDFYEELHEPVPDARILDAQWYVGADLFAFSPQWWASYGEMFPDFLMGRPCWDWIWRLLMGYSVIGREVFSQPLPEQGRSVECPDIIYHEKHDSWAERPGNYHIDPGNRYNFRLAIEWLRLHAKGTDVDGSFQFPPDQLAERSWFCQRCGQLSKTEQAAVVRLTGSRFVHIRVGYNSWPLQLGPDGKIGEGHTSDMQRWSVWDDELVFADRAARLRYTLREDDAGRWVGQSVADPQRLVELVPVPEANSLAQTP